MRLPDSCCGKCDNCLQVRKAQQRLMPNPPFRHADDHTVYVWNETLKTFPCLNPQQAAVTPDLTPAQDPRGS